MDNFFVQGTLFDNCVYNLMKVLRRYEETSFVLNWEKSHFMVIKGLVLGHRVSGRSIEIDKERIEVI